MSMTPIVDRPALDPRRYHETAPTVVSAKTERPPVCR